MSLTAVSAQPLTQRAHCQSVHSQMLSYKSKGNSAFFLLFRWCSRKCKSEDVRVVNTIPCYSLKWLRRMLCLFVALVLLFGSWKGARDAFFRKKNKAVGNPGTELGRFFSHSRNANNIKSCLKVFWSLCLKAARFGFATVFHPQRDLSRCNPPPKPLCLCKAMTCSHYRPRCGVLFKAFRLEVAIRRCCFQNDPRTPTCTFVQW